MSFCCKPASHDIAKPSCLIPVDEEGIIEPTPRGPNNPQLLRVGHEAANEIQLLGFVLAAKFAQEGGYRAGQVAESFGPVVAFTGVDMRRINDVWYVHRHAAQIVGPVNS